MSDYVPFIAIGNDELGDFLHTFVNCPHCGEQHEIQCSSQDSMNKDKPVTLQFYKCGEKSYLVGINNKEFKK